MSFIKQFLGKEPEERVTVEDIIRFKNQKIEENLNLDYKDIRSVENFNELAKDVSAFANSAGGSIILGIEEKKEIIKDKKGKKIGIKIFPGKITWGKPSLTKEQIEQGLRGKIHYWIEGLRIIPIRKSERSGYVIFLIDIPQSENPPHMVSPLHRYYKRLNFEAVPMEHYEIADFFGKRRKPFLKLNLEFLEVEEIQKIEEIQNLEYKFRLRFYILNQGKAIAKYTRFTATFENLEILNIEKGDFQRIDDLRGNKPSTQFDSTGIFYPTPTRTRIGEIVFRVKNNAEKIKIYYNLIAEDMDLFQDTIIFDINTLKQAKTQLEQKERPFLLA
jgi:hypothetical protein